MGRGLCIAILACLFTAQATYGQSRTSNLMLGARLNGTSWKVGDLGVDFDSGAGASFVAGYGISDLVTLFGGLTSAAVSADERDAYTLTHFEAGARFTLRSTASRLRPYGETGLVIRSAEWHEPTIGDLDILGPGAVFGAGLAFFVRPSTALDLGTSVAFGNLTDVEANGQQIREDLAAFALRINLGVVWYPFD